MIWIKTRTCHLVCLGRLGLNLFRFLVSNPELSRSIGFGSSKAQRFHLGFIKSAMENLEQQFQEGLILTTSRHETQSSNSVREHSPDPIPVDLLIEIFSRVPLKSIARFHCLSKFLASILRRHDFTELFLTKSLTRPRLLFTVKTKGKLLFYSSPQPHNQNVNSSLVATPYHCTSLPNYRPTYISKPVCGLVLLQGLGIKQCPLICNPAKGKVLTLPKVPRKKKHSQRNILRL